jgi:primosomal replication protein N
LKVVAVDQTGAQVLICLSITVGRILVCQYSPSDAIAHLSHAGQQSLEHQSIEVAKTKKDQTRFELHVDLIQTKWMKLIHNLTNVVNQGFQRFVQLPSII